MWMPLNWVSTMGDTWWTLKAAKIGIHDGPPFFMRVSTRAKLCTLLSESLLVGLKKYNHECKIKSRNQFSEVRPSILGCRYLGYLGCQGYIDQHLPSLRKIAAAFWPFSMLISTTF